MRAVGLEKKASEIKNRQTMTALQWVSQSRNPLPEIHADKDLQRSITNQVTNSECFRELIKVGWRFSSAID